MTLDSPDGPAGRRGPSILTCISGPETPVAHNLPEPPPERWGWGVAVGLLAVGGFVLALVLLTGAGGRGTGSPTPAPPVINAAAPTPTAGPTPAPRSAIAPGGKPAIVAARPGSEQQRDLAVFDRRAPTHVPAGWVAGFYPIYSTASKTFGVNWLLLASVHDQETAFSTAAGTYRGLNFVHCCGGPMQFNVTNGRVTTWDLVSGSYVYAARPAEYPHPTGDHPSIYDDFDALMAAARLLETDGRPEPWTTAHGSRPSTTTGMTRPA